MSAKQLALPSTSAVTGLTSQTVLVDALPYIDSGFDDASKAAAMNLIQEECKKYRPTKDYLAHLPAPKMDAFETDIMRVELERLGNQKPMDMLSMKRYELPGPPPGKMNDVASWNAALDNSKAQLEHQHLRMTNLALIGEYGSESWRAHLKTLDGMIETQRNKLVKTRQELQNINYERKQSQTEAGAYLRALEASWVGLVSKNYQLEQAVAELEAELGPIAKKYKSDDENVNNNTAAAAANNDS